MNTLTARQGLTKIKLALAAMVLACAALAFTANGAKAANVDDPIAIDFNYAALTTGAAGEVIDTLVLKPSDGLGALKLRGTYKDNAGNFTLPKATGLEFPQISVPVGPATVNGSITLSEDGIGNYNDTTGVLSMNAKIVLTLGVDKIEDLGLPIPGEGALACAIGPLDLDLSTSGKWPHAAAVFADAATAENGSVAGYWDYKPDANSVNPDGSPNPAQQGLCDIIGGLLDPVGGLWLANSASAITDANLPAATGPKPDAKACEKPKEGTYPDCTDPVVVPVVKKANITKVTVSNAKVKAGKKAKITIKVTNKGDAAAKNVKVTLKSSNKQVKIAKSVTIKNIAAGKTVAVKVVVKTTKKAKGKANITAKTAGKTGKGKVTVQKAKKKRKK